MKQFYKYYFLTIILTFLLNISFVKAQITEKKPMIVVIDAGHGGKDPGAMGPVGNEKDLVLTVALKVGKYIQENVDNVKVIYTRDKDVFVELYKRARIANQNKADLFISIHANANESSKPYGAETYIMGTKKNATNLAVAKRENQVILKEDNYQLQYDGFDPNSPEANIIFSLYQNQFRAQSLMFAGEIQKQFREKVHRFDRGVKEAGFLVLYRTTMPSVLIELGFVSNPDEAKFLFSEQGSDYMASAIYRAFKEYKQKVYDEDISEEKQETKKEISKPKQNIVYKVQIATMKKEVKIKPQKFKGLKDVTMYKDGNLYKFFYGNETDFDKIVEIQKKVREKYPDAFVVAFKNGKKISVKEAKKLLGN